MLCDVSEGRIGYKANFLDEFVMISHEAKMRRHRSKIFPSGKCGRLDDEAGEISGFFNVWINRFRKLHKVVFFE